jgi:hypothetical protein
MNLMTRGHQTRQQLASTGGNAGVRLTPPERLRVVISPMHTCRGGFELPGAAFAELREVHSRDCSWAGC